MILKVFGIYDSKVGAYLPPFMMKSVGEAERALTSHVNDPDHNFAKYAEDFTLFELGSWDDATARYTLLNTPHSVAVLIEYKRGKVDSLKSVE
ncbi:MAG: nonstructural protein [Arizlama microvirus]|nr:MAG: nonstructural protein [Arizlama microvirus]